MKDYYCLNIKFKDKKISEKTYHSHLFISDKEMYLQIIDNDEQSRIDNYYSISDNSLGLFDENFEIINTEVSIIFDNSRIYKIKSFCSDEKNKFFTIFLTNICIIKDNIHKEYINEGAAFLNKNGLSVVNLFYSFFSNFEDKNTFTISRMSGMHDYYEIENLSFRPELEFENNEQRGSEEFTIKKKPTINFRFQNIEYKDIKNRLEIICHFLSFLYGVRIVIDKLVYRTEKEIYFFRNTEPNNKTYVSDLFSISGFLKNNCRIEKILKTNWFENYLQKEKQITKAIDNLLHAREVNMGASFVLLFNIIEIFNINQNQEKFSFNIDREKISEKIFNALKSDLNETENIEEFKKKVDSITNKIEFKPFTSPLEETLILNNINPNSFGHKFSKLKKTRDKITHGSLSSISDDILQSQLFSLRKIAISLILSNLGFKNDLKQNII